MQLKLINSFTHIYIPVCTWTTNVTRSTMLQRECGYSKRVGRTLELEEEGRGYKLIIRDNKLNLILYATNRSQKSHPSHGIHVYPANCRKETVLISVLSLNWDLCNRN